jgi:hypothetical protein
MATPKTKKIRGTIVAVSIGQSKVDVSAKKLTPLKTIRSFPTYASHLPQYQEITTAKKNILGRTVRFVVKAVPPENYLVEATAEHHDIFGDGVLELKDAMLRTAEALLLKQPVEPNFKEEFSFYCVSGYRGDPKQFFSLGHRIVPLLKSENVELSQAEINKTLHESSLQYAKDDLTIIDWDGACVFDQHADWQDTIDVLEVANVNLLRLRRLDQLLDQRLDAMASILQRVPKISGREVRTMLTELMRLRTESVAEFEHAERDIQLIGDWYAGRLYAVASKKLHLDRWRQSIRQVLESLEDMSSVASEQFTITSERRAEQVQQVLWYIQLIGWFVLLYFEWRVFNS